MLDTTDSFLKWSLGYGCERPDYVVWGRIMEGLWNFGLENSLSLEQLVGCFVGAWKMGALRAIQKMEAWLLKFQREV